ncbi:hypothetical protein BC792_11729 [Sphingobacterium allocomposti]|uniref:Uncharacterized protein n=1 Tax=Sphingobacterium allocomposti TaxID=415956 RepID=A0A5S5D9Q6_9SPHI|nr:hypothetical protein [Sphingobacterium composti Yoo et al. 2007 non Ten et al. 2007]TYP92254.1 hypothetical protein BC792_11729 [Sphingobacterium composti Yoo et al. 2007 non Ten et al. 2007]
MKQYIIGIIFLCSLNILQGQHKEDNGNTDLKHRLLVTLPSKNYFNNKYVERIAFAIDGDTISSVSIQPIADTSYLKVTFLEGAFKQKFFFFDFGFIADRIIFKQKYPHMQLSAFPGVRIVYTNMSEQSNKKSYFGVPAKYLGDLKEIETRISRDVMSTNLKTSIDSVLIYEAIVSYSPLGFSNTQPAKFELQRLLYGQTSVFSDIAEKNLRANETNFYKDGKPKWSPAIQGSSGRPMETKIKVYVRLNTDGSVTLKLPRMLGNFTGD